MKARGFTLIELIVVIVITGILAGVLTVFLRPAIDSYLGTRTRANLGDIADTALRRMGDDIRSAVPNSIRMQGAQCFQLVPTITGGRYRMARDTTLAAANASAWLDTAAPPSTGPSMSFDVFNRMRTVPAANDWVVIDNQIADDVYNGTTRAQILGVNTPIASVGRHRIFIQPHAFPSGYDGGRFVVVGNAAQTVVYSCNGGILYRAVASFGTTLAAACAAATGGAIVASNVGACTFTYDPNQGATQQSGFLQMQLTLTADGENVTLVHGVHVENTP